MKTIMQTVDKAMDRIFAVLGAIAFSQGPALIQQYVQSLAGGVSELQRQVVQIEQLAKNSGKTLPDYILKFTSSQDPDFAAQGQLIQGLVDRYHTLQTALNSLLESTLLTRPLNFVYHLHYDVLKVAWAHFTPSINFSVEGILYALVGLFGGYAVYTGLKNIALKIYTLFSKTDSAKTEE